MEKENMKKWKKRFASIVMCLAVLMTTIPFPTVAKAAELPADLTVEKAFAIKDGNFQCGDDYWNQFVMLPEWEWSYTTNASFEAQADGMLVTINDVGANGTWAGLWTVALDQEAYIYGGYTYNISFDVTSSIARTLSYGIEENTDKEEKKKLLNEEPVTISQEEVGEVKHVTYELESTEDFDGKFYFHLGAPAKGISLDPHTVKLSNVKVEVAGAEETWVPVNDTNFTDNKASLQNATIANGYVNLEEGGSITYPNLNVVAGKTYEMTFVARTNDASAITATIGDTKLTENQTLAHASKVYSYTYTATETKTMDLTISASGSGYALVDNIGFWDVAVKEDLALGEDDTELEVAGAILSTAEGFCAQGKDVEIIANIADFAAWSQEAEVYVETTKLTEDLYDFSDGKLIIGSNAFSDVGKYSVSVVAPGYRKSVISIKIVKADGNILENGDFQNGFVGWTPSFNEKYSGDASITLDYMAKINISFFLNWWDWDAANQVAVDRGPVSWSTLLQHDTIPVKANKTYKISFWASSTVKRPIMLQVKDKKFFFVLDTELKEYTAEWEHDTNADEEVKFEFHLGPITSGTNGTEPENKTGIDIAETDGHTMYFADVMMVDAADTTDYSPKPSIIGVDNGATYTTPVSINVGYRGNYTFTLTKDGEEIPYTLRDIIKDNGTYVFTVKYTDDPDVQVEKTFTIEKQIDYTKKYYAIKSKATELVVEATGVREGGAVVQSSFEGRAGQLFTIEKIKDEYYIIRALSTGKVIQVADASKDNFAKLEQAEYVGTNNQLWKFVDVPQGFVKIENKGSGKVIDISNAMSIENLQLQQYDNSGNGDEGQSSADGQRFDLVEIKNVKQYMETEVSPVQTEEDWIENAFITPIADKLNPAGPIAVEWYAAPGEVESYDIYFDGKKCKTVTATDAETLKSEDNAIYSTEVASHTMKIVANYAGGKTVETKPINFYITKKGVGWATLHRTEDLNLSWYYHWSLNPALGTDEDLTFVPMVWGNYGDEWLADPENQKYGTVLSFNEPDWSDQSNVPVTKKLAEAWVTRYNAKYGTNNAAPKSVEESWQAFMDSGLRVGSPATALAPPFCNNDPNMTPITMNEVDGPDTWWYDFQQLMNSNPAWDYDFVAIHSYNGECDAEGFLKMVDMTYAITGKPIWITEFGVAEWGQGLWEGNDPETQQMVKNFMIEVINGLEERDFVERYAWFPFDPNDAYGGASGIFNYATGELNELGMTYAMLGLPEGYEGTTYDVSLEVSRTPVKSVSLSNTKADLKVGDTLQLNATVVPGNATNNAMTWSTSNPNVASVDQNGKVKAVGKGTATITVKTADGGKTATCNVTVTETSSQPTPPGGSQTIPVNGVELSKTSLTLNKGKKATLTATIDPGNATDKTVKWSNSNPKVASFNEKTGEVKALAKGTTTITVTTANGKTASCKVTVKVPSTKVKLNTKTVYMVKGKTLKIKATMTPKDTTDTLKISANTKKTVATASLKKNIITIKAKKVGKTVITVKTTSGKSVKCTINVVKKAKKSTKIKLNKKTLSIKKGASYDLVPTLTPKTSTDTIKWTSSNRKIATVDAYGTVTGKKGGTVTITAKSLSGKKATCKVTVKEASTKVKLNKTKATVKVKKSVTLKATLTPTSSTDKVTWKSSNTKVATVSSKGKVTGKKKGTATITVKTSSGKKATCKVTVK